MPTNQKRIPAKVRRLVIERAHQCCEYCVSQEKFATQSFSIEHIDPRSQGGNNSPDNLAFACQGCNGHKFTKTKAIDPLTKQRSALYNPRKDSWADFHSRNIQIAKEKLDLLQMNEKERHAYESFLLSRANANDVMEGQFLLGQEQGIVLANRKNAHGMRQKGFALSVIAEITGLTEAELAAL